MEVNRVQTYFDSAGDSLLRELSAEREAASASLAFEDAAAIHVRVEKLKPVVSQLPEIVQRLDRALRADDSAEPHCGSVAFFRIDLREYLRADPVRAFKPLNTRNHSPWNRECKRRCNHSRPRKQSPRWKPWNISPC